MLQKRRPFPGAQPRTLTSSQRKARLAGPLADFHAACTLLSRASRRPLCTRRQERSLYSSTPPATTTRNTAPLLYGRACALAAHSTVLTVSATQQNAPTCHTRVSNAHWHIKSKQPPDESRTPRHVPPRQPPAGPRASRLLLRPCPNGRLARALVNPLFHRLHLPPHARVVVEQEVALLVPLRELLV